MEMFRLVQLASIRATLPMCISASVRHSRALSWRGGGVRGGAAGPVKPSSTESVSD